MRHDRQTKTTCSKLLKLQDATEDRECHEERWLEVGSAEEKSINDNHQTDKDSRWNNSAWKKAEETSTK
jgi:hypothetical protein